MPCDVIGNMGDFGSSFVGSSPAEAGGKMDKILTAFIQGVYSATNYNPAKTVVVLTASLIFIFIIITGVKK